MNEEKRLYYLDQMGIQAWMPQIPKDSCDDPAVGQVAPQVPDRSESDFVAATVNTENIAKSFDELKLKVAACSLCGLHRTRTQTVFGAGHPAADWLIIGEAPGADEDCKGEPFVGRAGQLLTNMLRTIGLAREEVFISNILKCRPPGNRDPQPQEIASCHPYLRQQIEFLQPKIILAVGRIAAQSLLNIDTPIGQMRGKKYSYEDTNIPVVATYHPAYLLRSPQQKRKAWEDLQFALKVRESH